MRGFPNRILYPDFKQRYAILGGSKVEAKMDLKKAAEVIFANAPGFEAEKYRLGKTKVRKYILKLHRRFMLLSGKTHLEFYSHTISIFY